MTPEQFAHILPNAPDKYLDPINSAFDEFSIDNTQRQAMFLAQAAVECGEFTRMEENLNYSADRLLQIFPKYFSPVEAAQFSFRPEAIANRVYANRYGNGDESSGDGWKFRGRGIVQITFQWNYKHFGDAIGIDLLTDPSVAINPEIACRIYGAFWNERGLSPLADSGDVAGVTKKINGGANGLLQRNAYYTKALRILS